MTHIQIRTYVSFGIMAILLLLVGLFQSWSLSLSIINLGIISAVMAIGVNIQWGYAGLFNVGIMGFAALGGLSVVLVAKPPIKDALSAGGLEMLFAAVILLFTLVLSIFIHKRFHKKWITAIIGIVGFLLARFFYLQASDAIEAVDPALSGYLGGLGMPVLFSWVVGGILAALAAFAIGKISLGMRSDYLAIATLGISEIIISIIKNEDWISRGVKNVTAIPRPVPYEIDLQKSAWFNDLVASFYADALTRLPNADQLTMLNNYVNDASIILVKLCYMALFMTVLLLLIVFANLALDSPWGRMVRAIRDNEVAAAAMGKNIKARHLQIFVIGSAIVGFAGAMLVTYDGQFTPGSYNPLRYTFVIWVMVIVGGSGNNLGAVIGGFTIWFMWIESEAIGFWMMDVGTSFLDEGSAIKNHLLESAQYMRLVLMGLVLLLVMRFSPKGIIPEQQKTF